MLSDSCNWAAFRMEPNEEQNRRRRKNRKNSRICASLNWLADGASERKSARRPRNKGEINVWILNAWNDGARKQQHMDNDASSLHRHHTFVVWNGRTKGQDVVPSIRATKPIRFTWVKWEWIRFIIFRAVHYLIGMSSSESHSHSLPLCLSPPRLRYQLYSLPYGFALGLFWKLLFLSLSSILPVASLRLIRVANTIYSAFAFIVPAMAGIGHWQAACCVRTSNINRSSSAKTDPNRVVPLALSVSHQRDWTERIGRQLLSPSQCKLPQKCDKRLRCKATPVQHTDQRV